MSNLSGEKVLKLLDILSYVFLASTAFVVPFVFDSRLVNFFIIPKEYGFIGLVLASVLIFATKIVVTKKVSLKISFTDIPVLVLLGVSLFSAIFSMNVYDSFFGRGEYFILSFLYLVFLAVFYFLIVNVFTTANRWRAALDVLLVSGGLSAIIFILHLVFKFDVLFSFGGIFNTIDNLNSIFGVWLVIIFLLSAGQLMRKELPVGRSVGYFFISILSLVSLILVSFQILWWLLLIGLMLLLVLGFSYLKEMRTWWISVLFSVLILVAVFIVFGSPKSFQSTLPLEISLGVKPSWAVTSNILFDGVKSFAAGYGLGSFGMGFSKFRSADFNNDSIAWSLRFNQPHNSAISFLSDGGILLFVVFGFLVLFVLGHVFNVWFKTRGSAVFQDVMTSFGLQQMDMRLEIFLVAISWMVLTVALALTFFGPMLWWLWWFLLGLVITGLSFISSNIIKHKEWELEDSPQYSLSFSFILIVLMAGVIMLGVWGARLYMAEVAYAKALRSPDFQSTEANLRESAYYKNHSDVYHAALAQVYLTQAVRMSQETSPDVQGISTLLAAAVNEGRIATDLAPKSVALWENLALMYENAGALVPEAKDWAIKAWQEAKSLEPTNPVLSWRLGNSFAASGKWEDAIKNYQEAVNLKRDYVGAYIGLAGAYEQSSQLDKAIETYASIAPAAAQAKNIELLYNYGRVLYNRNKDQDRSNAEKIWLQVVSFEPKYSNALYSLGLLYENKGEKSAALQYYYKVKDLNPDNADIVQKIKSLVGEE